MATATTLTGLQIEGNLIASDLMADVLAGDLKGQTVEAFGLPKTSKLSDEVALAWGDAKIYWAAFQRALGRLPEDDPATTVTREQWVMPLLRSLGYGPVYVAKAEVVDEQTYAISHRVEPGDNKPPIHAVGCRVRLEQRPPSGTPRLSAHALVQDYLNRTEHLWAIVTNGLRWRLLRDSSLMTRLTYVEFDLAQILDGENFAEFGLFYRLFHRSRLPQGMEDADDCLLEFYHQESVQQGGRVRDRLRDGVEQALKVLGTGFLQHPANESLRQRLGVGHPTSNPPSPSGRGAGGEGSESIAEGEGSPLSETDYYRQLLLLIYRLLFLMVAESRNLLLSGEDGEKSRIYREYYSIERLRALAEKPSWRREGFQDLWQGLRVTFRLFDENWRGQLLGLSPLNGVLFGSHSLLDIDDCAIDNHDLTLAIRHLSLYQQRGQLRRVNYGALDVEELGSVYESLLDFHPQVAQRQGICEFQLVTGSDRKTTGSYYTPPELVGQLIKSALEPVIEERLKAAALTPKSSLPTEDLTPQPPLPVGEGEQEVGQVPLSSKLSASSDLPSPSGRGAGGEGSGAAGSLQAAQEQALLSLKICDPACGSGHFLLAAARRIGKELARIRTGEAQPGPEPLRVAIRDVIQHCIYGVDLNPLAVDLCKVALWLEGLCRGVSLNFLDHRIKCGNSLVGVLDLDCLKEGIPDNAYKPVTGDDKTLATQFKKRNKKERDSKAAGQLSLELVDTFERDREEYAKAWREIEAMKDDDPTAVRQKQEKYERSQHLYSWRRDRSACNLWTAAFFMPLTEQNLQLLPTSGVLDNLLKGNWATQEIVAAADELAEEKHFFHWPLEFPEVFEQGGFDCVLSNPPWELLQLREQEFLLVHAPEVAKLNGDIRKRAAKKLFLEKPSIKQLLDGAIYDSEAQISFFRESGRFPLTAVGRSNTYALFAEVAQSLISNKGFLGAIVPTGIATDKVCKDFFGALIKNQKLDSLYDFENRHAIFPIHRSFKFSLLTISGNLIDASRFAFFLGSVNELGDKLKTFELPSEDIEKINPNTLTCPVFRSTVDARLTQKIYKLFPVLENEANNTKEWGTFYIRLINISEHEDFCKYSFEEREENHQIPLYEGKLISLYDHRFATFEGVENEKILEGKARGVKAIEKKDPNFKIYPRYFVCKEFIKSLFDKYPGYRRNWLLAWRDVARSTDERTCIPVVIPKSATTVKLPCLGFETKGNPALLIGNLSSLILDYVARQKVGSTSLSYFILKQLPVLPPDRYSRADIDFIAPRVLELTYTAWDLQPFAQDMGYHGDPFTWNPDRRAHLRAELDAYYAHLYGLTRDELRYILDPTDIHGPDFPSETFRVLKNNEIKQYGEYRTQRLVLEAWDKLGF